MSNHTIFVFPGTISAPLAEVGGKGLSLMQGSQAGLPVPPGFILSVSFFLPWLQELQATKAWSEFIQPNKYDLETSCHALQQHAFTLSLTKQQEQELSGVLQKYDTQENTQEQFENNQLKRKQTYETLYQKLFSQNPKQAQRFAKLYQIYETFAGYREAHKYYAALVVDLLRQRILQEAKILYEAKRLDSVNQIFDLTLEQLDNGLNDISLDLKELAKKNRLFIDRLSKIPYLPTLIDSRGLIIKPHAQTAKKGEISGMPVSPGIVKGKVKILYTPSEKPFLKGEILVARATDPGWTPLFVNASAVILEVGGMLQHGALVAREYGLPCVTGVENATTLWKDGTMVEVDGSQGIIRMIAHQKS